MGYPAQALAIASRPRSHTGLTGLGAVEHVRPRWAPHVFAEDGSIDRAGYEACVLSGLRDGLRSGDVYVGGSNRFRDFED